MSCSKPQLILSDTSPVAQNTQVVESNQEYTELVQESYEKLFGPWLKSDEEEKANQGPLQNAEADSAKTPN
jgi:hypothetical protein